MTKEEIKRKIKELEEKEKNVKGTDCEVYTRIVGYLRPVNQFNDGKQQEFAERKEFRVEEAEVVKG